MVRYVLLMLGLVCTAVQADAGFILSIQNGQSFAQNSGVQTVDIYASSLTSDAPITFSASFGIDNGGEFASTAGVFGQAGMIGFGNVDFGNSNFNNLGPGLEFLSTLNVEFNAVNPFPAAPSLLGRFQIDTATFAVGTYTITPFLATSAPDFGANTFNAGSFSITPTAVPEPSSLALVGMAGAGAAGYWRKRRAKKQLAAEPTVAA